MGGGEQVEIRRAGDRFRTDQDGITTFHSFSYGRHYDPGNVGFGPIIALNEENVPPGGGYETHFHADVEIVTWVLEGALAHEDTTGSRGVIEPGVAQWLSAGDGVQHSEHNASRSDPLRFLQLMLRSDHHGEPTYESHALESAATTIESDHSPVTIVVATESIKIMGPAYVHVARGEYTVGGSPLGPGDAAELMGPDAYDLSAPGPAGALIVQVR